MRDLFESFDVNANGSLQHHEAPFLHFFVTVPKTIPSRPTGDQSSGK